MTKAMQYAGHVKELKATAFDIMQFLYNSVNDSLIHCLVKFADHIDEKAIMKAVTMSTNSIPLIRCCFNPSKWRPCWEDQGFTGEDIIRLVESEPNIDEQITRLLATKIDFASEPQLKIFIIREQQADTLCIIINHMVCDGAGFKEYLYLLSDLYTKCKKNENNIHDFIPASRSTKLIFDNFTLVEKLGILLLKNELVKQKEQTSYSLQGDKDNPLFITVEMTKPEFTNIKAYAKNKGVTINDLMITAYARVLFRQTGKQRVIIPCPVDLRRYLHPGQKYGICNLTGNYICDVLVRECDSFDAVLSQVVKQMQMQKSSQNCLKPVMMLELGFRILPFRMLQKVFHKVFSIPVISFSNLGVIDKKLLNFDDGILTYAYLTGTVKSVPYFQIAVSTCDDICTLSSNQYGTAKDEAVIKRFLIEVRNELVFSKPSVEPN